jgi:membrane protease YdiL (CAAX protease family)
MRLTSHQTHIQDHAFELIPLLRIAIGAALFSLFIAFTNKPVADFLYFNVVRLDDPALNALEFSVYPLLIAFGVTLWRPGYYGLQIGGTIRHWRTVLSSLLVIGVIVGAYVFAGNRTPWDSRGLVNFTVVPLYEEIIYRGILFTLILAYARRHFTERQSMWMAVVVSALGFGLSHLSNGFYFGWPFTVFQVVYASLFGVLAGYNRAVTGSLIAPFLLHALMNALPILL